MMRPSFISLGRPSVGYSRKLVTVVIASANYLDVYYLDDDISPES